MLHIPMNIPFHCFEQVSNSFLNGQVVKHPMGYDEILFSLSNVLNICVCYQLNSGISCRGTSYSPLFNEVL